MHERSKRAVIQGAISALVQHVSGVSQGSILGLILFVFYINDLADIFFDDVTSKYFADDAKLYTEIKTGDDIDRLQFSLNMLSDWAETWQLNISIHKCCTMDLALGKKGNSFVKILSMDQRFRI